MRWTPRFPRCNMPTFRPETFDHLVWQSVHDNNEYGVPARLDGWVVVDVGLHIGSFSALCKERGAAECWGIEADVGNVTLALKNVHEAAGTGVFQAFHAACNRSDRRGDRRAFGGYHPGHTANGWAVPIGDQVVEVPSMPLDDLLKLAADWGRRRVSCLKMDCEGSEWPTLFTSKGLEWVDRIYGEYHVAANVLEEFAIDGVRYGLTELRALLEDWGFCVRIEAPNDGLYNHFWAIRANV